MFANLFRPKWQHSDSRIRLEAVRNLQDETILRQVLQNDPDEVVRKQVVRQLDDWLYLLQIARTDNSNEVCAVARRTLLQQLKTEGGNKAELWLREHQDEPLLEELLNSDACVSLRCLAVELVQRQSLLGDIAIEDACGELRWAAVQRLEQDSTLERVAKQARGKDKRVARLARERLEERQAEQLRPQHQRQVVAQVEELGKHGTDRLQYQQQLMRWEAISKDAPTELVARLQAAQQLFEENAHKHQQEQEALSHQRSLCREAEQLLEQAAIPATDLQQRLSAVQKDWDSLQQQGVSINPGLRDRFEDSCKQLQQRWQNLHGEEQERKRLQQVLETLQGMQDKPDLHKKDLERIAQRWEKAGGTKKKPHTTDLQAAYRELYHRLDERLKKQVRLEKELSDKLETLLDELARAITGGQLKEATSLQDRCRQKIGLLGGPAAATWQRRLQRISKPMYELKDWRRFGADRARQDLLDELQKLINDKRISLSKRAERLKQIRESWRSIDKKSGVAAEELWQAFENKAEEAYAPCQTHYKEMDEQRRQHSREREAFCEQWEQAYREQDWEQVQWQELESRLRKAHDQWHKLGGVEPRAWKALNRRFHDCMDRFESQLQPVREKEIGRREGLIRQIEKLADEPDLQKAIEQVKQLREQWKPLVSASRKKEQQLWQQLNQAADVIFQRRNEERDAQRREFSADLNEREALCESLEQLTTAEQPWEHRQHECERLRSEWSALPAPSSKPQRSLEARFDKARKAFVRAHDAAKQAQQQAQLKALLDKSELCDAMEQLVLQGGGDSVDVDTPQQAFAALPPLTDAQLEATLQDRWQRALGALDDKSAREALGEQAEQHLTERKKALLELEILLDIPSPAEEHDARMAMQIEMMADAMMGESGPQARLDGVRLRFVQMLLAGPVLDATSLHHRQEQILKKLS